MCQLQGQNDTNDVKQDMKREGGIGEIMKIDKQSSVKTNQLENIPSNNTFHILPFTYVTHDNPGHTLK